MYHLDKVNITKLHTAWIIQLLMLVSVCGDTRGTGETRGTWGHQRDMGPPEALGTPEAPGDTRGTWGYQGHLGTLASLPGHIEGGKEYDRPSLNPCFLEKIFLLLVLPRT